MHQDSANPQPGIWEVSSYYSPQVTSAVWYWGDGTSTPGLAPTHSYAAPGQYTICVTVFSNCGDSANVCQNDSLFRMNQNNSPNSVISVTVLNVNGNGNTTGIQNSFSQTEQISVYPNPAEQLFTLEVNGIPPTSKEGEISITNVLGGLVYSAREQVVNNSIGKQIDLKDVSDGAYFVHVLVGDKIYSRRIIIRR
jgi:hypothetical protein